MKVGRFSLAVLYSFSIRCMLSVTDEMWDSQENGAMTDFWKLSHEIQRAEHACLQILMQLCNVVS